MTRDVKWADWKNINPAETLKMFYKAEKEDLVPGIQEDTIPASKSEENMPVNVIPDEGERVRPNEISEKSSELSYLKKMQMRTYQRTIEYLIHGRSYIHRTTQLYIRCTIQS